MTRVTRRTVLRTALGVGMASATLPSAILAGSAQAELDSDNVAKERIDEAAKKLAAEVAAIVGDVSQ